MGDLAKMAETVLLRLETLLNDEHARNKLVQDPSLLASLVFIIDSTHLAEHIVRALKIVSSLAQSPPLCPTIQNFEGMTQQLEKMIGHPDVTVQQLVMTVSAALAAGVAHQARPMTHKEADARKRAEIESYRKKGRRNSMLVQSNLGHAKTVRLHIRGMVTREDMDVCRAVLCKVKGVISITFDFRKKHSITRVKPSLTVEELARAIARTQTMCAERVCKADDGEEYYEAIDVHSTSIDEELPEYPEDGSPARADAKAVAAPDAAEARPASWVGNIVKGIGRAVTQNLLW